MKKIENKRFRETYYEEVLENGLHVVLWQKPTYQKSLCMMATPFGALDVRQVDEDGKEYQFPAGIAHFLEHKMFAMKDEDVMDLFSQMGANVNAFTSYTETVYYASTSGNPIAPLHLLLDFVQSLDIDEASVEKEKGIIIQELHMYKEMSDQRLLMETYSSLYQEHPLKFDIGGDDESVSSTTLEQLQECYCINYHPSNMILICVSSQDPEVLMKEIRENQANKVFPKMKKMQRKEIVEPKEVARETYSFSMDVSEPKRNIAYKIGGIEEPYERMKIEWGLRFLLDANFTSVYKDYQTWMDQGIINDYCGCDVDFGEDYGVLLFYGETRENEAFLTLCEDCLQRMKKSMMDNATFEQLKRRYYAQSVRALNSFDDIAVSYIRNRFEGSDFFQSLDVLYNLSMQDIERASTYVQTAYRAIVDLQPLHEETM